MLNDSGITNYEMFALIPAKYITSLIHLEAVELEIPLSGLM